MHALKLHIPRLRLDAHGQPVVVQGGRVGEIDLRAGDRLVIEPGDCDGLLLLVPIGLGSPMLGRRTRRGLVAEPGGVPASPRRWSVAGSVQCVQRQLERAGGWSNGLSVSVRIAPDAAAPDLARARSTYVGGVLSSEALSALCLRAAMAPELDGVEVALGVAYDPGTAAHLALHAPAGSVSMQVAPVTQSAEACVIVGPWPGVGHQRLAPADHGASLQLKLFGS